MACGFNELNWKGVTVSMIILCVAIFIVLFTFLATGTNQEDSNTLRMVAIIFRHGDRNPTDFYQNDPYKAYNWPGGLGALTENGSLRIYNLGQILKEKYYHLIPPNMQYSQEYLRIISSSAERCIMSAQSFMAGFMPPLKTHNLLPILWQPIAIHTIPRKDDDLIAQKKICPKYDTLLRKLHAEPNEDLQKINNQNRDLYAFLTKETGQNITNVKDVEFLYNTLDIEHRVGHVLPSWTNSVFPTKMLPLAERNLAVLTETPFMKHIKGGVIVTDILDNMVKMQFQNQTAPSRSIFIYSGHDVTLINVIRALDLYDQAPKKPDFADALVFELHFSMTINDFVVRLMYYNNEEYQSPKPLVIPNCEDPCSLTNFIAATSNIVIRNYDELCK